MDAKAAINALIKTSVDSVIFTLNTSMGIEVKASQMFIRAKDKTPPLVDAAAVVGLFSNYFNGSLILGFPMETYLAVMSKLLGEEYKEYNPDLKDGVAELLNQILGQLKTNLNKQGFGIQLAIPTVIQGIKMNIEPPTNKPSVVIPYTCPLGGFYTELARGQE